MTESVTAVALQSALGGLSARQRAIADNVANINTPGYHAKRIEFEKALAASVARGSGAVAPVTKTSVEPTNTEGNNVNLDTETLSNVDTLLRYQFVTGAISQQFQAERAALRTS